MLRNFFGNFVTNTWISSKDNPWISASSLFFEFFQIFIHKFSREVLCSPGICAVFLSLISHGFGRRFLFMTPLKIQSLSIYWEFIRDCYTGFFLRFQSGFIFQKRFAKDSFRNFFTNSSSDYWINFWTEPIGTSKIIPKVISDITSEEVFDDFMDK